MNDDQRSKRAYFDVNGTCRMVVEGGPIDPRFPYYADLPPNTSPKEIWFDVATGKLKTAQPVTVALPEAPVDPFTIQIPANTVAEIEGIEYTGSVVIDPRKTVMIAFRGAKTGTLVFKNYADKRQDEYPVMGDQLDAMWKGGTEAAAMKVLVQAVKDRNPKPVQPLSRVRKKQG